MDNVLVLIQVVRHQQIRIIVDLGADQAVSACCLQVGNGPEIFLVEIVNVQGILVSCGSVGSGFPLLIDFYQLDRKSVV